MNKALHALVYLFLILAGAALWFELQLNAKRTLLTERNKLQEDYFVKFARTIEKEGPGKDASAPEIKKDDAPVEARLEDSPEMRNVLEDYDASLETQNLPTFDDWEGKRSVLRAIYLLDSEGNPLMDGAHPVDRGPGTARDLLETLFKAAMEQQTRLNNTRAALPKLREKLAEVVDELNDLKPKARQDKVTIQERDEKIAKLEKEKSELQGQITSIRGQIESLNGDIVSLRDEINTANEEIEKKKEEIADLDKKNKTLEKLLQQNSSRGASVAAGSAVSSIPFGDKGKILEVDNENMFAIVSFTDEAMKQLKGNNEGNSLPLIELSVKRPGVGGIDEFVGRVRIRQEIPGKNYAICDVLAAWQQTAMRADDVVFAD